MIANRVDEHPELDVLTFVSIEPSGDYREEIRTYRELWKEGQRIARALKKVGMRKSDRFALLLQNHPEFVDAMVASSIIGTVFVPIDPRKRHDELAHMLRFAECRGVICADYSLEHLLEVAPSLPDLKWVWIIGSNRSARNAPKLEGVQIAGLNAVLDETGDEMPVAIADPDSVMQMLYTSGTTGRPKAMEAPYSRYHHSVSLGEALGFKPKDRPYTGLSLSHANAQMITLGNALFMGLRAVISRKFTKAHLWDICRRYNCTSFNLLGGMTTAIYSDPRKPNDADHPVRFVLSAGMPAAIWEDFRKRFGVQIFEFYAAAEGGLTLNPPGAGPVGSVGKPTPNLTVKVVDENDQECLPNRKGHIVFRNADGTSPRVSYYKDPKASQEKTAGGWLRMGDIGHIDKEGWVYFDYRAGSGIRRNGEFIDVASVEKAIAEHPDVNDVFVYGVKAKNGVAGEKDIVAAVVPISQESFSAAHLFAYCGRALAVNYVPAYIQIMAAIPKTASEKPQERFCLEEFYARPEQVFEEQEFRGELKWKHK